MKQLRKAVRDYLKMRRGLGFKLIEHEARLREFVLFLTRKRKCAHHRQPGAGVGHAKC